MNTVKCCLRCGTITAILNGEGEGLDVSELHLRHCMSFWRRLFPRRDL